MPGPRVFELHEVNSLLPEVRAVLEELAAVRQRIRDTKLRINALEMIWGEAVHDDENPDHRELQHHLGEMRRLQGEFERHTERLGALGAQLKGLEPPLLDFYGVRDGHLVLWCWTGGEDEVSHWHHVDEGFAGRQPV